jgi:hypothetical protein
MNYALKIKKPHSKTEMREFNTHQERNEWLRSNGFYEVSGIYRHLDGSVAGIFSVGESVSLRMILNCDKPIKSRKGLFAPWMT